MPDPKKTQPVGPSPEALAAFYRLRSESLRGSHTTTQDATMNQQQQQQNQTPVQTQQRSWFQSLMHAFGAEGY